MSAQSQMRAMLDQLMGTQRDGTQEKSVRFTDDTVCKTFLIGCCPSEILLGTRADIGECHKTHDLALKADFEMASKNKDYFYDFDAFEHLKAFVADTDEKIVISKKRLAEQQAEISAEVQSKANAVHDLNEKIGKLLVKAEEAGSEGNIEESKKILEDAEKLKVEKNEAEEVYRNSMPASTYQQQKLRVCDICSAYLGLHDNDCRLADHFGGKLHAGFIEIREELAKLELKVELRKAEYEKERVRRQTERDREADERRRKRYEADERRSKNDRERSRRSRSPRHHHRDDGKRHRRRSRSRSRERSSKSHRSSYSSSRSSRR